MARVELTLKCISNSVLQCDYFSSTLAKYRYPDLVCCCWAGRHPAILPLSASVVKMLDSDSGYGSVTSSTSDTQSVDCVSDTSSVTTVQPVVDKHDLRMRTLQLLSAGAPLVDKRLSAAGHQLRRPNVLLENQCMTRSVSDLKR